MFLKIPSAIEGGSSVRGLTVPLISLTQAPKTRATCTGLLHFSTCLSLLSRPRLRSKALASNCKDHTGP